MRAWVCCGVASGCFALLVAGSAVASSSRSADPPGGFEPPAAVHHDVSPPLRDIPAAAEQGVSQKTEHMPLRGMPVPAQSSTPDPVVQTTPGTASVPTPGV